MRNVHLLLIPLLFLFSACNSTQPVQPLSGMTATPELAPVPMTDTPVQDSADTECGYAWASEPLVDLSKEFGDALKKAQLEATGYAEAYGENCLNNQGEVVRFLAMETDFHVTLKVEKLEDKEALGELTEQALAVIARFPVNNTPGPQPGYIGITFSAPGDELRLWFTQADAKVALENGLHGEKLFNTLQIK
jgi:hypothetical protein